MSPALRIRIRSQQDLFGHIRILSRTFGTGSEANEIDIFLSFFVLKSFMNTGT
jgi:hypothetical protein